MMIEQYWLESLAEKEKKEEEQLQEYYDEMMRDCALEEQHDREQLERKKIEDSTKAMEKVLGLDHPDPAESIFF